MPSQTRPYSNICFFHKAACTHNCFYDFTNKCLLTEEFTHRLFYTQMIFYISFYISRIVAYKCSQMFVHRKPQAHLHMGGSTHQNIYTQAHLPSNCLYAERSLHAKVFCRGAIISKISSDMFDTRVPVHTDAFTNNLLLIISFAETLLHTRVVTQKRFCTHWFFTRKNVYTIHPDAFRREASPRRHTKSLYEQKLLLRGAFAHRSFYTRQVCTQMLSNRSFHTQVLLHAESSCTQKFLDR